MALQIADAEGLRAFEVQGELSVAAEAFSVDVVPSFPDDALGLDFGDVRVNETVEKSFQVANNGKYAVKFQWHIRRRGIRELLQIDNGLEEGAMPELQPGQKLTIKATATAPVAMQLPDAKRSGKRSEESQRSSIFQWILNHFGRRRPSDDPVLSLF